MKNIHRINGNIYISNDEEIKDGDWLIVNDEDVMQMKSSYDNDMSGEDIWVGDSLNGYATYKDNCKKIILTTDQSLNGVQSIDDEFLEWFVAHPSCEEVEIDSWTVRTKNKVVYEPPLKEYEIIIPKEEPKQKTISKKLLYVQDCKSQIKALQYVIDFYEILTKKEIVEKRDNLFKELKKLENE